MKNALTWLLLSLVLSLPTETSAAAFLLPSGSSFTSVEVWRYHTAQFWDDNGKRQPSGNDFHKSELNIYLEHGVSDKDTLLAKVLYDRIDESLHGRSWGFVDPELGWRHLLCRDDRRVFSWQLTAILPAGSANKPSIRYSRCGIEGLLLFAHTIEQGFSWWCWKRPAFYDIGAGYRALEGFPGNQLRAHLTLGKILSPSIDLYVSTFLEYGLWDGKARTVTSSVLQEANYRLLKGSATLRIRLTKQLSASLGYERHLWGENTGTGGSLYGGLWMDL